MPRPVNKKRSIQESYRLQKEHRLARSSEPTLQNWKKPKKIFKSKLKKNAVLECGWGRLIFAHTFETNEEIAKALCDESKGSRNIGFYLRDPHVVLSLAPHDLFLDPSHTYRIWFERYRPSKVLPRGFSIRRIKSKEDIKAINRIYSKRHMVPIREDMGSSFSRSRKTTYLVAEDKRTKKTIGAVLGIDHAAVFNDPELGSSLWSLAVDPDAQQPGIGEALTRTLIEHYHARVRRYLDLSVMHDNQFAIQLYEKIGFERVPVFCVKHKNALNEPLYIAPRTEVDLNPYAEIIVNEARRRGIAIDILDTQKGYFSLSFGGRSIVCRESLTELTSSIAVSWCDDKRMTYKILKEHGFRMPAQTLAKKKKDNETFLRQYKRIVVKPSRGEQGQGVFVDIRTARELHAATEAARKLSSEVILEEYVTGKDLRLVVIAHELVAASIRVPPSVTGTGQHSVRQLIQKLSRRRASATGGESKIPLDDETLRCVKQAGYKFDSILKEGHSILVRKTANLHTGAKLVDVTARLHPRLKEIGIEVSKALKIPVVGLDLVIQDIDQEDYYIIEANERPGLANHEPQPTAEKFIDLLFPQTKAGI